jgi:flagellar biosynthesis/type III secretory pathway protein FliH
MSSSERPQPLRLVDFGLSPRPEPRGKTFTPASDLAQLGAPRPPAPDLEEVRAQALAEGEARGRAAARKELEPALARFEELLESLAQARAQRIAAAEQDLLDIAAELARRILHGELQQGGEGALRMARACLHEAAASEGALRLHVAPADAELLRAHLPELQLDLAERSLELVVDAGMSPGGVVVESAGRCYEGRPERVLAALAERARGEPA